VKYAGQACIFCGGDMQASTEEHCPPRAMFRDKIWPEGYSFPSCEPCNNGSSDEDLIVAFMAQLNPNKQDEVTASKGLGLMKAVNKQATQLLGKMMTLTAREARTNARRLGMKPAPGQLYREIGIVKVPEEMDRAVQTLAGKLTKGIFFRETGTIFPKDGGIMFHWFTNAQRIENGEIPVLNVLGQLASMSKPKVRATRDLSEQFDYLYSCDESKELQVIQATFNQVFGFVTISSSKAGALEEFEERMKAKTGVAQSPFVFLSTNRATA
jgi:hypothetical protein